MSTQLTRCTFCRPINPTGDEEGEMGDDLPVVTLDDEGMRTATKLSCSNQHTCIIMDNGAAKCWSHAPPMCCTCRDRYSSSPPFRSCLIQKYRLDFLFSTSFAKELGLASPSSNEPKKLRLQSAWRMLCVVWKCDS